MDLFDVMKSCLRRWYLLLPLLAVSVWFGHGTYAQAQPVYYANAVIGIAPPSFRLDQAAPGLPVPRNGLLDIGGAPLVANMAALGLRQPAIVDRVVAAGGMPDYVSRMFPVPETAPPIPLVMIEDTAADAASATKTLELVTVEMTATLRNIQKHANVPEDMMVTPFVVSPPSEPVAAMPSRTRATITVLGAGFAGAVLLSVIVDVVLVRWRQRRSGRSIAHDAPIAEDETVESAAEGR